MNGRPTTRYIPRALRRPLLWAALCSLILHLPLLALFSPFFAALPESTLQSSPEPLLFTLVSDAGEGHKTVSDLSPDTEIYNDQVSEPAAQSEPIPAEVTASPVSPVPTVADAGAIGLSAAVPAAAQTPLAVAAVVNEPVHAPATVAAQTQTRLPPPVQMSRQDISQIQSAMQTLLTEVNENGIPEDLNPTPSSLGLPASDSMTLTAIPVNNLSDLRRVDIILKREIDGHTYHMRARLQERALSHYAKFINRWDDNVMLSNDRIDGRFHANSAVNFESSAQSRPQFNGEVTIANRQSVARRLRQSTMFAEGLRTGTGRIPLPEESLPAHWLNSEATVMTLNSDTRLDFRGSEGVIWTDLESNSTGHLQVPDAGLILAGTGRTRVELSGMVAGKVLVYSPRQLTITGDLVYTNNTAESADYLALISEGSIDIAPASVTGAGDLEIHGALYARQRFSVRRFRDSFQGTLYVYGALVAGSVSATEPRFNTHIEYDRRFDQNRPPAFPSTGLFDLVAWDQQWTTATGSDALLAGAADNAPIVAP